MYVGGSTENRSGADFVKDLSPVSALNLRIMSQIIGTFFF